MKMLHVSRLESKPAMENIDSTAAKRVKLEKKEGDDGGGLWELRGGGECGG